MEVIMKQQATLIRVNNGRDLSGAIMHYGKTMFSVDATNEALVDLIISNLSDWKSECTLCAEDSDHYEGGISVLYIVDSSDIEYFKADFKEAKKKAIADIKGR
ncbi:hypothetical protein KNT64_gp041 [Pseudomonas phage PspYZU05]|uniref:Uncharacterized protein n=1 Tax=Pseudomonas phage PspYZU05 TaxID=1983556 RepID=A0A2U7N885_9CAUD|nr:hypothetical protein KNT64_gp041 [Pseudomonas phage PspYZU05]ASD51993.1 hypothetical protein PspYZU05_41 [Pseudomonas phage PspYZU05]